MCSGWIKLHRKMIDWEWYSDINVTRLFTHLLLTVNYRDKKWRGKIIKRGQLATSVAKLSAETGLSPKQVRTALKKLIDSEAIEQQTSRQFSVFTIVNFADHQDQNESIEGKQGASQRAYLGANEKGSQVIDSEEVFGEPSITKGKQGANKRANKGANKGANERANEIEPQVIDNNRVVAFSESRRANERASKGANKGANKRATTKEVKKERIKELKPLVEADASTGAESIPDNRVLFYLPLASGEYYPLAEVQFQKWAKIYPGVNIQAEINKMIGWLDANPQRRKTKKGILRFMNSWLSKQQDRAGCRNVYSNNIDSAPVAAQSGAQDTSWGDDLSELFERSQRAQAAIIRNQHGGSGNG